MGKIKKIKEERKRAEFERKIKKAKSRKRLFLGIILFFLACAVLGGGFLGYKWLSAKYPDLAINFGGSEKRSGRVYDKAPDMQIDVSKKYTATMETSKGKVVLELSAKEAPKTVNNFVVLSRDGFYDDLSFHRIVKDFMIQGGDPSGNGSGGPGYTFDDEKITGDYVPGTLAMANSGPNTNGSQFFIMTGDYSKGKLPKNYTIFGKVIEGMNVVQKIAETAVEDNGQGEVSKPKEEVKIVKITVEEE